MIEREPQGEVGGELDRLLPVFEQNIAAFANTGYGDMSQEKWNYLLQGLDENSHQEVPEQRIIMNSIRGVDEDARGYLRTTARFDAPVLIALDELIDPHYNRWYESNISTVQHAINGVPDYVGKPEPLAGTLMALQEARYRDGMDPGVGYFWTAYRTAISLNFMSRDVIRAQSYSNFESHTIDSLKKGTEYLHQSPNTVPRLLTVMGKAFPGKMLGLLASDPSVTLDEWADDFTESNQLREVVPQDEKAHAMLKQLIGHYVQGTHHYSDVHPYIRLLTRLPGIENALSPEEQRQTVIEAWFNKRFNEPEATASEDDLERVAAWLPSHEIQDIESTAMKTRKQYDQAMLDYNEQRTRREKRQFPQSLLERDPVTTPIVLVPMAYSLDVDDRSRNGVTLSALRVLTGDRRGGIIMDHKFDRDVDARAAYEAQNVEVRSFDNHYYEEAASRHGRSYSQIDEMTEETAISLLGLNQAEHGNAEVVLWAGNQLRLNDAKLAEAVKRRIGKYPHILYVHQPIDQYEGYERWDVKEFIPAPDAPKRPTYQSSVETR